MHKTLILLLLATCVSLNRGHAQTIIDLKPGGTVRSKTIDDYKDDMKLTERLRQDSLDYVDNLRRAFNALHTDSLSQAEAFFKESLKLRPNAPGNHIVRYNLAQIDRARGHNAQAVEKLSDLVKQYPDYYEARLSRAEICLQQGLAHEAIRDANVLLASEALKQNAPDLLQRVRFVRAAARFSLRLYVDARADLNQILIAHPENESAQILQALTLQKIGQPKEALNRLNLIVSANPKSVEALTTRAEVKVELGMDVSAKSDYDALIELLPNESAYYIERAKIYIRLEEKLAARRDLDKALQLGVPRGMLQPFYQLVRKK